MSYNRIIDYAIEQANRNDGNVLQFEQDIEFRISRERDSIFSKIVSQATGFDTLLEMQTALSKIEVNLQVYIHRVKTILNGKFDEHALNGKRNTSQLIEVGLDVEKRSQQNVREMDISRDDATITFIENHAFELLNGYEQSIINRLRAEFGNLLLKKSATRYDVQKMVEKILDVTPSKAQEIAQNELSRAYNYGTITRFEEYERETGSKVRKYWHGFEYSKITCPYCKAHIGEIYDLNDDTEVLPAHSRCRCMWLPVLEGWDKPVDTKLISRANMLTTAYSEQQIYDRVNSRLNIRYADYLSTEDAAAYLSGDRSPSIMSKIAIARDSAIDVTKSSFQIAKDNANDLWAGKFNSQMKFWTNTVAEAIVDNDKDLIDKSYEGIKGVMVLPWKSEQLIEWNKLLNIVDEARR